VEQFPVDGSEIICFSCFFIFLFSMSFTSATFHFHCLHCLFFIADSFKLSLLGRFSPHSFFSCTSLLVWTLFRDRFLFWGGVSSNDSEPNIISTLKYIMW
jgi:hypothetical protein